MPPDGDRRAADLDAALVRALVERVRLGVPRTARSRAIAEQLADDLGLDRALVAPVLDAIDAAIRLDAPTPIEGAMRVGRALFGGPRPVIVAGPPVVESRACVEACASALRDAGADVLYGGCFDVHASARRLEARGLDALALLEEVGRSFDLAIATDVVEPSDVGKIARRADLLVVPERLMGDRALLAALARVDTPVLLRRGTMATLDEWLGAAAELTAAGNPRVILCERAVRAPGPDATLELDLADLPALRARSLHPIVIDPHGVLALRNHAPAIAKALLSAGAEGLVLEIHPDPANAAAGEQALTLDGFAAVMRALRPRDHAGEASSNRRAASSRPSAR